MVEAPFAAYRSRIERELRTKNATEESHRPALKTLLEALKPGITATTEPKRVKIGAPDYAITRATAHGPVTVGYIETKDIGVSLDETERGEQMRRYLPALHNLVLTDYLEFRWYVGGAKRLTARLATREQGKITPVEGGVAAVDALLTAFLGHEAEPIKTPRDLAERMARLTHLIRDLVIQAFETETASPVLRGLRGAFTEVLLPDLTVTAFADMFAQTLAYGLFAARYNHRGPAPFQRLGAAAEIPKTNPFLRDLFHTMTGPGLNDEPFVGFVDDLARLLAETDMAAVLADFGKQTGQDDPVVHFYETFLTAYDPKLREKRGVYYTPGPVVSYIVRSVDHLLKTRFNLPAGLADTAQTTYTRTDAHGETVRETAPRVLILDPACGTGTFLYSVIAQIRTQFQLAGNAGKWSGYVRDSLLKRLFGFELLMAPYAVAHLKLGLELAALDLPTEQRRDWAYDFAGNERLGVYLTNSLEEAAKKSDMLMGAFISEEANAAAVVKRDLPVMVVIGNPPYSGHSANTGAWISKLVRDYYQVDGKPLGERNPKWLQDDYVKFIRFGQWRIAQTGAGVLAFITNHGYLDNPTFRGMRQQLLETFSDIYVLNLHGNSKKREKTPDGGTDANVFDIQQGVSIAFFVKEQGKDGPAQMHHVDLWGLRQEKYLWLAEHGIATTDWTTFAPQSPLYLFMPQDADVRVEYDRGWKITDVMPVNVLGFQSHRDQFAIAFDNAEMRSRILALRETTLTDEELRDRYRVSDNRDWQLPNARKRVRNDPAWQIHLVSCSYRPFDERMTYFDTVAMDYPRTELRQHMLKPNLSLHATRQTKATTWQHALVADAPASAIYLEVKDGANAFPLYLYPPAEGAAQRGFFEAEADANANSRRANLDPAFIASVAAHLGMTYVEDGTGDLHADFGPEDVFHYLYAVLHSPMYRSRYAEFLKTDFPRVPLTRDTALFRILCARGKELVALHLMESPALAHAITRYPIPGSDTIEKGYPRYYPVGEMEPGTSTVLTESRLYINKGDARAGIRAQYFAGIPQEVWDFHIGGYQVCEKWLKDRRGRTLTNDDLTHYERIVVALAETIRLMDAIDAAIPAWPLE